MRCLLLAFAAVTLSTSVGAQAPAAQRVAISMVVEESGEIISKPRLEVLAGETGTIMVDDGHGQSLRITIVPTLPEDGSVQVALDAERKSSDGEALTRRRLTSTVTVNRGETALVTDKSNYATVAPLTITLRAEPVEG